MMMVCRSWRREANEMWKNIRIINHKEHEPFRSLGVWASTRTRWKYEAFFVIQTIKNLDPKATDATWVPIYNEVLN
jgi:hypothetical protein